MTQRVTEQMVEEGARAAFGLDWPRSKWEMNPQLHEQYRIVARTVLYAAPDSASVAVKPLEWEHLPKAPHLYERWEARTIIGSYRIVDVERLRIFQWHLDSYGFENCTTADEAKAAAQADYERRILSALTTQESL